MREPAGGIRPEDVGAEDGPAVSGWAVARSLILPALSLVVFGIVFVSPQATGGDDGVVPLVQKDAEFKPVPPELGGAFGAVRYDPKGSAFPLRLSAEGLKPGRRYKLSVVADGVAYTLGPYVATADAKLAVDTTLAEFADGPCAGSSRKPSRALRGRHEIKFWVQADGSAPPSSPAGPCGGNGDGDYTYVLLENEVATFRGR